MFIRRNRFVRRHSGPCSRGTVGALFASGALVGTLWLAGCTRQQAGAEPPPPEVRFRDVAAEAGLDFRWQLASLPLTAQQSFGCGCAFFDYDRDGLLDILLVGEPRSALFRNRGNGTFEDVTERTGLNPRHAEWKGVAVGDYDGDGWPDLYLTAFGDSALLRNEAGRRWVERTREAGVVNRRWGSSAGFADLDHDGDLDLFVGNYVHFGPTSQQYCIFPPGVKTGCPPVYYPTDYGRLFRNDGNGRFTDVTRASGVHTSRGANLAVGFADVDNDGRTDFYISNDGQLCDLMRNEGAPGTLRFRNVADETGAAFDITGGRQAGMSVDFADFDRDGWQDLLVTTFSGETYSLYRNERGAAFVHRGNRLGVAAATHRLLGFGARWLDADNDGWPDLIFANGHVYDRVAEIEQGVSFRQPTLFMRNEGGTAYRRMAAGPDLDRPILGRGLATGDFDNDGLVDVLVVDYSGAPLLLRNETPNPGTWLGLIMEGPRGNPSALGARVTVRAGGYTSTRDVSTAAAYLSSSDPRPHFGLGRAVQADEVTIRWPDGTMERHLNVRGNQWWVVRPGSPLAAHPAR